MNGPLNSFVYHRNIFASSSKVFGNLRKSSDIFGNFRKFSENVRERSSGLRNTIFYSLAALVRKILFCHSKIKFISSRHRVISSISSMFFYLCKVLFSRFLQFNGNFVHAQNNKNTVTEPL